MYAVIATGGKQYRVEKGTVLQVEKLDAEEGATVQLGEVLLFADGDNVKVGAPLIKGSKVEGEALDQRLNKAAGQRFHNHSPLDFERLKGDPDNIEKHLVSYIKGFSKNVRDIFDFFDG